MTGVTETGNKQQTKTHVNSQKKQITITQKNQLILIEIQQL